MMKGRMIHPGLPRAGGRAIRLVKIKTTKLHNYQELLPIALSAFCPFHQFHHSALSSFSLFLARQPGNGAFQGPITSSRNTWYVLPRQVI